MSHSVTYNGNTSDGGTPPTDPKSPYNAGDTVTVQPVGSLSKTGAVFAYWNTEADGSAARSTAGQQPRPSQCLLPMLSSTPNGS